MDHYGKMPDGTQSSMLDGDWTEINPYINSGSNVTLRYDLLDQAALVQ